MEEYRDVVSEENYVKIDALGDPAIQTWADYGKARQARRRANAEHRRRRNRVIIFFTLLALVLLFWATWGADHILN